MILKLTFFKAKRPLGAKIKRNQLFASLLEKALAKEHGSYNAIINGSCIEGLQTITGQPCSVFLFKDSNQNEQTNIWRSVISAEQSGYIMTCLCNYTSHKFKTLITGLYNKHIYSILDAREFVHEKKSVRLLKLRNPWGGKEWKGEWSNFWPHWPQEIKDQVSINPGNGTFWISYDDIVQYFYDITISKVRPDWFCVRKEGVFMDYSKDIECFTIDVTEPGEIEIELFSDGRCMDLFDRTADPAIDLALIVCKVEDVGLRCVGYEHKIEQIGDYVSIRKTLTPGTYIIFPTSIKAILLRQREQLKPDYKAGNYFKYNIVFHSSVELDVFKSIHVPEIVSDLFYTVSGTQYVSYELNDKIKLTSIFLSTVHAIYAENLDQKWVRLRLDTTSNLNIDRSRVDQKVEDYLGPKQRKWICFSVPLDFRKVHNFKYDILVASLEKEGVTRSDEKSSPFYGLYVTKS